MSYIFETNRSSTLFPDSLIGTSSSYSPDRRQSRLSSYTASNNDLQEEIEALLRKYDYTDVLHRDHADLNRLLRCVFSYVNTCSRPDEILLRRAHACIVEAIRAQVSEETQTACEREPSMDLVAWTGETMRCIFTALTIGDTVDGINAGLQDELAAALQDTGQICYESLQHVYLSLAPYRIGNEIRGVGHRASKAQLEQALLQDTVDASQLQLQAGEFHIGQHAPMLIKPVTRLVCLTQDIMPVRRVGGGRERDERLLWQEQALQSLETLLQTALSLLANDKGAFWPLFAQLIDVHNFCAQVGMLREAATLGDIVVFIRQQAQVSALRMGFKDSSNVIQLTKAEALEANAKQVHLIFQKVVDFVQLHNDDAGEMLASRICSTLYALENVLDQDGEELRQAIAGRDERAFSDYFVNAEKRLLSLQYPADAMPDDIFHLPKAQLWFSHWKPQASEWHLWGKRGFDQQARNKAHVFTGLRKMITSSGFQESCIAGRNRLDAHGIAPHQLLSKLAQLGEEFKVQDDLGLIYHQDKPILYRNKNIGDRCEKVYVGRALWRDDYPVVIKQIPVDLEHASSQTQLALHHLSVQPGLCAPLVVHHLVRNQAGQPEAVQQIFKYSGPDLQRAYMSRHEHFTEEQRLDIAVKVAWYLLRLIVDTERVGIVPDDIKEENFVLPGGLHGLSDPQHAGLLAIDCDSWPLQAALELALTHSFQDVRKNVDKMQNLLHSATKTSFIEAATRVWSLGPHMWNVPALRLGMAGLNSRSALYAAALTVAQVVSPDVYAFITDIYKKYTRAQRTAEDPAEGLSHEAPALDGSRYVYQRMLSQEYKQVIVLLDRVQNRLSLPEWGPICRLLKQLLAPVEHSCSAEQAIKQLTQEYADRLEGFRIEAAPATTIDRDDRGIFGRNALVIDEDAEEPTIHRFAGTHCSPRLPGWLNYALDSEESSDVAGSSGYDIDSVLSPYGSDPFGLVIPGTSEGHQQPCALGASQSQHPAASIPELPATKGCCVIL